MAKCTIILEDNFEQDGIVDVTLNYEPKLEPNALLTNAQHLSGELVKYLQQCLGKAEGDKQ